MQVQKRERLLQLCPDEIAKMGCHANDQQKVAFDNRLWKKQDPDAERVSGHFYYKDIYGEYVGNSLRFRNCSLKLWNRLIRPDGTPLVAKGLAYYFSGIQWRAGRGWPIYSSRCPLSDTSSEMMFPNAKRHQLIVQFGDYYWPENSNSNAAIGNQETVIFVGVNDDLFNDNTGVFDFIVTSYCE